MVVSGYVGVCRGLCRDINSLPAELRVRCYPHALRTHMSYIVSTPQSGYMKDYLGEYHRAY